MRRTHLGLVTLLALSACTVGKDEPSDTDIEDTDAPDTDVLDTDTQDTDDTGDTDVVVEPVWTQVVTLAPEAFLSVDGTSDHDVWAVGADNGKGPVVLHYDGAAWTRLVTGTSGDLWWVDVLPDGTAFMAGSNGVLLKYKAGAFTRVPIPGLAKHLSFGVWAAAEDDLWVAGAAQGRNGYVWHWDGLAWDELPLPSDVPLDSHDDLPSLFKVWSDGAGTMWVVGGKGVLLRSVNGGAFTKVTTGVNGNLFTVAGAGSDVVVVGGDATGAILSVSGATVTPATGPFPLFQGVAVSADGQAWATGEQGRVFTRTPSGWSEVQTGVLAHLESLHAAWVDPQGGLWTVGGNTFSNLADGAILHFGAPVATWTPVITPPPTPVCPAGQADPAPDRSIARRWNEQIIGAIRRDIPRPGVHSRNLYHLSVAMWDAWAAYDSTADGVVSTERINSANVADDRDVAISYAAYRLLHHRYATAIGGPVSEVCFDDFMGVLGLDPTDTHTSGDDAIAVGNRIGQAVIDQFHLDGANEANNYADTTGYTSVNAPLYVDQPGTTVVDPEVWQPLVLAEAETQNGIPTAAGVQVYIGAQWKDVTPFALERPAPGEPYFDLGGPPTLADDLVDQVVEVIQKEALLDPDFADTIDLSPGSYGNNSLGANDGVGHATNPVTGQAYAPNVVRTGDFGRVLAEFWADGPKSETPPGHWNVLANDVSESPDLTRNLFGVGAVLDELSWDVHLYLALDGAVHDAAIAAWEQKRVTVGPRPITLVRWMAQNGQRSDSGLPSYSPNGLPLVPGLIELITAESCAPGQRHERLARYVGRVAILGWRGEPGDRANEIGAVDWEVGTEWIPYQRRTFVTPAFPGYVSGHSTFSRAAAEVLTSITDNEFFPGGLGEFTASPGSYLVFEDGPSAPVTLQWATYFDAADQAGQSRVYGGIHVSGDDFAGRTIGHDVGQLAVEKAKTYFDGTAR